jgi:hypothetical protein
LGERCSSNFDLVRTDHHAGIEDRRPFDDVAQLAHIARPIVLFSRRQRLGGTTAPPPSRSAMLPQEMLGQPAHPPAVGQRGKSIGKTASR